jgi:hypothetical protein
MKIWPPVLSTEHGGSVGNDFDLGSGSYRFESQPEPPTILTDVFRYFSQLLWTYSGIVP